MIKIEPNAYKEALLEQLRIAVTPVQAEGLDSNSLGDLNMILEGEKYNQEAANNLALNLMVDNYKELREIYIIGAGGVASWFLPQLLKNLHTLNIKTERQHEIEVIIMDADKVEQKNVLRQNFIDEDVGQYKAKVLADRYDRIYPLVHVLYLPTYGYHPLEGVELPTLPDHYREFPFTNMSHRQVFVINTVDNEVTKHMLDAAISESQRHFNYMSIGCWEYGGTVTTFNTRDDYYSLIYSDTTFRENGGEIETLSCAEIAEATSDVIEQTFDSNILGATIGAMVFQQWFSTPRYAAKKVQFVTGPAPFVKVIEEDQSRLEGAIMTRLINSPTLKKCVGYIKKYPQDFDQRLHFKRTYGELYTWTKQHKLLDAVRESFNLT